MKKIFTALCLIQTILNGCAGKEPLNRWEGISGNRMRIYISDYFKPEKQRTIITAAKAASGEKAMLVLASHATLHIYSSRISRSSDRILNNVIGRSLETGKILSMECSENNYCRVLTEYDISSYIKILKSINSD